MTKAYDLKKIVLILVVIAAISLTAALSILVIKGGPDGLYAAQQSNIDQKA